MRLDLGIMAGAESKSWLADLSKIVDRMEKVTENLLAGMSRVTVSNGVSATTTVLEKTDGDNESDDDFGKPAKTAKATKSRAKKAAAPAFDEEESELEDAVQAPAVSDDEAEVEVESDDDADQDFTTPPAKTAKATKEKKLTLADVNDACKARAGKTGGKAGRAEVLAILKKKFKTESVSELKPEQFAACVAAMES